MDGNFITILDLNGSPKKFKCGSIIHTVYIGAPHQELFIDGIAYEKRFGLITSGISVDLQYSETESKLFHFQLEEPTPGVYIAYV
jgi:hypothetical protein